MLLKHQKHNLCNPFRWIKAYKLPKCYEIRRTVPKHNVDHFVLLKDPFIQIRKKSHKSHSVMSSFLCFCPPSLRFIILQCIYVLVLQSLRSLLIFQTSRRYKRTLNMLWDVSELCLMGIKGTYQCSFSFCYFPPSPDWDKRTDILSSKVMNSYC